VPIRLRQDGASTWDSASSRISRVTTEPLTARLSESRLSQVWSSRKRRQRDVERQEGRTLSQSPSQWEDIMSLSNSVFDGQFALSDFGGGLFIEGVDLTGVLTWKSRF